MPSKQFRRNHHYHPRWSLKEWSGQDKRIWTYKLLVEDQRVPLWTRLPIRGVACRRDLYTSVTLEGESDEVEAWLHEEFELPAQVAIGKIKAGQRLAPDDYRCLARWFAAQDRRTPASMDDSIRRANEWMPSVLQSSTEATLRKLESLRAGGGIAEPAPPPFKPSIKVTVEKTPPSGGRLRVEATVGRGSWLEELRFLLTKTSVRLLRHRWTILRPPRGMSWPTSDDPAIRLNWFTESNYTFRGGWGSPGTELLLPLTPSHLLYTQIGHHVPPRDTVVPPQTGRLLCRIIAKHAHRMVFAVVPDDHLVAAHPRTVGALLVASEEKAWRLFNQRQGDAERSLLGAAGPTVVDSPGKRSA
jgi:hypothetical protein